ncbi:MAG: Holliday junction resolvase RuvX [Aquificae bacterium]|nr:Holliday junction resolvase RuvX [Aquificota bacterium]
MKVLAVDYGTKRVGLAVGDEELKIVSPKEVVKTEKALTRIKEIVKESGIGKIILGYPITLSGKEGQRARLVKAFYEKLKQELPEVEVILWDERFTTDEAMRRLRGLSPKKKKELKDLLSAMIILEEYLDSL